MNNNKPMTTRGEPESLANTLTGGAMLAGFMVVMFWLLVNGAVLLN